MVLVILAALFVAAAESAPVKASTTLTLPFWGPTALVIWEGWSDWM